MREREREREREMKIGSKIPASLELEDMKNKKKLEKAAIELQFAVR
jgi:hypothetical protein